MGDDGPPQVCRWVSRRLPLLAGGELTGDDRRRVERHLRACRACRRHHAALDDALTILHRAAAEAPAALAAGPVAHPAEAAPALWPALRQQIREERHAPRGLATRLHDRLDAWLDDLSAWVRFGFGPPFGVGRPTATIVATLGLATVLTVSTGLALRARRAVVDNAPPTSVGMPSLVNAPALLPAPPPLVAGGPAPVAMVDVASPAAASTVAVQVVAPPAPTPAGPVHGDLDHGTPMGPDSATHQTTTF